MRRIGLPSFAAVTIAVLATILRLSLTGFPTNHHDDEPIVASLAARTAATGRFSADWEGFPSFPWSRPTLQFSPYSLLQSAINTVAYRLTGWPADQDEHIRLARRTSACFGGLTVLILFLAARQWFASAATGLLAAAMFAFTLVNVQDSIYARVDAFVGLLAAVGLWLAARSLVPSAASAAWSLAACLTAGVGLAAKYNALPFVVIAVAVTRARMERDRHQRVARTALLHGLAGALGVFLALPEAVVNPSALLHGLVYEFDHYTSGHPPFEAFDAGDNNLRYWTVYLTRVGLGYGLCLATGLFVIQALWRREQAQRFLLLFLAVGLAACCLPRVRFERNLEPVLGALVLAAAAGLTTVLTAVQRSAPPRAALAINAAILALVAAQPIRTLIDFRRAVEEPSTLVRAKETVGWRDVPTMGLINNPPTADLRRYDALILYGFGDPFSLAEEARWRLFFADCPIDAFDSSWSRKGYPFCTVDVYHGPARTLLIRVQPGVSNAVRLSGPR